MHYYRYRPFTEINCKELMYDEMFFCSPRECNDPFDSRTYFEFTREQAKWKQLILIAWKDSDILSKSIEVEAVAEALSSHCPMSYDYALSGDFEKMLANIVFANTNAKNVDFQMIWEATQRILAIVRLYKMPSNYFVSFSKLNNEILMWSHYAAKHEGFCLVFKSVEGQIRQCPTRTRKAICRETPGGLAPSMSYGLPESFPFQDIEYVSEVQPLNAFNCFPSSVAGQPAFSEEDRLRFCKEQSSHYLQKHIVWKYEDESRLTLSQPTPWLFGGHFDYSFQERLLHYEPTQLVGIILGARMTDDNKTRIKSIITERKERIARSVNYKRIIFDFLIFEASLAHSARDMIVKPVEILGLANSQKPDDPEFERRYREWENGSGLCFEGNSCSRVCIKS